MSRKKARSRYAQLAGTASIDADVEPGRFDVQVGAVMIILVMAIIAVILRGDQVGLTIQSYSPDKTGTSHTSIEITLEEPVQSTLLNSAITLNPNISGKVIANGNQIIFKPSQPLKPDQQYTVDLHAGIRSAGGRELKQDFQWQFRVAAPRIAYLGPMERSALDVYLLDAAQSVPTQITHTKKGILSFDVAPDGQSLVYSELQSDASNALFVLDLATMTSRSLFDCRDGLCVNPIFSPDGTRVSFEKSDLNSGLNIPPGPPRLYIADVTSGKVQPLFSDSQQLGYSGRWSPDSNTIAVFSVTAKGIVLHNLTTGQDHTIPSFQGEVGSFSPDGKWFLFPALVKASNGNLLRHIMLVDLSSPALTQHPLVPDSDPADYHQAIWAADSKHVIALIKPSSDAQLVSEQIFSVDTSTGSRELLVDEPTHLINEMVLSPTGNELLLQRFPVANPGGAQPELWTFDLSTKELKQVGGDGIFVRWIP